MCATRLLGCQAVQTPDCRHGLHSEIHPEELAATGNPAEHGRGERENDEQVNRETNLRAIKKKKALAP